MAEAAAAHTAVRAHPGRRAPRAHNVASIAGHIVKSRERGDLPAVLARVHVRIDTRLRMAASLGVVHGVEDMAGQLRINIRVLTGENRACRAGEKTLHVAIDTLRRRQKADIAQYPVALRIGTHILRLEGHELLEVG